MWASETRCWARVLELKTKVAEVDRCWQPGYTQLLQCPPGALLVQLPLLRAAATAGKPCGLLRSWRCASWGYLRVDRVGVTVVTSSGAGTVEGVPCRHQGVGEQGGAEVGGGVEDGAALEVLGGVGSVEVEEACCRDAGHSWSGHER